MDGARRCSGERRHQAAAVFATPGGWTVFQIPSAPWVASSCPIPLLRARLHASSQETSSSSSTSDGSDSRVRGRARPRRAPRRLTWWQPGRRRFTPAATRHVSAEMSQPPGAVAAMGRLASIPWLLYAGAWRSPAEARPEDFTIGTLRLCRKTLLVTVAVYCAVTVAASSSGSTRQHRGALSSMCREDYTGGSNTPIGNLSNESHRSCS